MPEVGLHRAECARAVGPVHLGEAGEFDGVADRGTGAVRLHQAHRGGIHGRRVECGAIRQDLRVPRWCRDVHCVAVLVGGGATHHGQDPVTVPHRVRQALEQYQAAPLGRHESVRSGIKCVAVPGRRQHPLRRPGRRLPCVQQDRRTAGESQVALALVQAAARQVQREQTRRTCGVDRDRGAVRAEEVGDPPRRHAEVGAGEAVCAFGGVDVRGKQFVVAVSQPDEDAGQRAGQGRRIDAGVLHGFPRRLEQQPVLWIKRGRLPFADPEELWIEPRDVIEEGAPLRDRPAGHSRLGVVVLIGVPPVGGNLSDEVGAPKQRLPQLFG